MAKYTENIRKDQETPFLELRGLGGLDLKSDFALRNPAAWQLLENFDCYRVGSVRKVKPPKLYGPLALTNSVVIVNFIEYRQVDTDDIQLIGIASDGGLYDLTTGTRLATLPGGGFTSVPFMCVMSGTLIPYNFTSWITSTAYNVGDAVVEYSTDGNLYIFTVTVAGTSDGIEPPWPLTGSIGDGSVIWTNIGRQEAGQFKANYLVIVLPSGGVVKWDGTSLTNVGVSIPEVPIGIKDSTFNVQTTTDPQPHFRLVTGFQYAYTWFNPRTLAESSPSPLTGPLVTITEVDNANLQAQIPGSYYAAIITPQATPTQVEEIQIQIPADQLVPPYGDHYTHLRFYRTRDGGATLFLLQLLYDANNNLITDANGAVLPAQLSGNSDYRPIPVTQSKTPTAFCKDGYVGARNILQNPIDLGVPAWQLFTAGNVHGSTIVVLNGAGQLDPNQDVIPNGFMWNGVGSVGVGFLAMISTVTIKEAGSYSFKGYIDATAMVDGVAAWSVQTEGLAFVLNMPQVNGTAGYVSGTAFFNPGTYLVVFYLTAPDAPLGTSVIGSNPIFQQGASISTNVGAAPLPDAALIVPAPGTNSNGPPPSAVWGAVYQGSLYLLDTNNRIRVWFSGDYWEYFGLDGFLSFDTDTDDHIIAMEGGYDRLIIGKDSSIHQLFGTDPTNFQRVPIDPQHGVVGRRLVKAVGSTLLAWINQGITSLGLSSKPKVVGGAQADQLELGFSPESLIGESIIPVTDLIDADGDDDPDLGCITIDNYQNILLIAFKSNCVQSDYNNAVILGQLVNPPLWSIYSAIPALGLITVREVKMPSGQGGGRAVLMSGADGKMYRLFVNEDNPQYVINAQAFTQPLPLPGTITPEIWVSKKVFSELYVEGQNLHNFLVAYSTDGGNVWTVQQPLRNRNKIGMNGRQITIWLQNTAPFVCNSEDVISYMSLNYKIQGVEQTQEIPINPPVVIPAASAPLGA